MEIPATIRVLMVEDHPVVRFGLRQILARDGIKAIEEADSIQAALVSFDRARPDLVIVDLSLGREDGFDLLLELTLRDPGIRIFVYSVFDDLAHVARALRLGVRAYVTKGEAYERIAEAVRACLAGDRYFSPRIQEVLEDASLVREGMGSLSLQEQSVYALLGQGRTSTEIATRMDLSPRTVESYCLRIQKKLGLDGMKELRQRAISSPI